MFLSGPVFGSNEATNAMCDVGYPHTLQIFSFSSLSLFSLFNISNWMIKSLRMRRCWGIRLNEKQVAAK